MSFVGTAEDLLVQELIISVLVIQEVVERDSLIKMHLARQFGLQSGSV